mgnify:CR=1 FL=1
MEYEAILRFGVFAGLFALFASLEALAPRRQRSQARAGRWFAADLHVHATGASNEFTKAFESQAAEAQQQFAGLVEAAAKNAPAGSESAVAVMKSAVSAASTALESVQKAVKQATDMAEANIAAVTNTAVATAKTASKKR